MSDVVRLVWVMLVRLVLAVFVRLVWVMLIDFEKVYSCAMFVEIVDDCRVGRCLHSLVKFAS